MSYEIILFDADGTLFDFDKAEDNALEKLFDKYNFNEDNKILIEKYKDINVQLWKDLEQGKISSSDLKLERFRRLCEECRLDADFCKVSSDYLEFLAEGTFLLDGAEEICEYLSGKYILSIITNGIKEVQYSRVENSVLSGYIKYLVVSEEAGSQKPASGIFEYAFEKMGHDRKDSVLIIGDSLSSDIQGGINFGIDTCWYNPKGDKRKGGIKPVYEINHLKELKRIV